MKAGLLICDHIVLEWQAEFGDYPAMFAKLFPSFKWQLYNAVEGVLPADINECDFYMSTGSKYSVYQNLAWLAPLKAFIQELYVVQKPFIGFCFGHQLLGEALGGKVEKAGHGWCVGVHKFEIVQSQSWMNPPQSSLNLLMMCQDQITQLPPKTKLLASSQNCPNGVIQIGETMLGIQAHPEFPKRYNQRLMETRVNKMGLEKVEEGIQSLQMDIHPDLIQSWVVSFLNRAV